MLLGNAQIDPALSPAVLDTATWDRDAAAREVRSRGRALQHGAVPVGEQIRSRFFLARLSDSQRLLLQVGSAAVPDLGSPLARVDLDDGTALLAYPADADVIDRFCRSAEAPNGPRALGRTPRLGIGTRMTTRLWPGVFGAMDRGGFAANAIQNSVRELNLLGDLRAGAAPERIYASGFGMIESGYTGSTFEGLWLEGVLAALEHDRPLTYGADADHIQVKRADAGFRRALRVVDAARYYTFFTLDVADVLSYDAFTAAGNAEALASGTIADEKLFREVLAWHQQPEPSLRDAGNPATDREITCRCVGKYWAALQAVEALARHVALLRPGIPVDLEFAFDEHPPEIAGPDCITLDAELVFVAREIRRRGLAVTHLAPNFGVEKGFDYRLADGLEAFERRVASQHRAAAALGFLLDVHSADDLGAATRRAIHRATGGSVHYKISPSLHHMFAQTVHDLAPEVFARWWEDALEYARAEARSGSRFAADCVREWEAAGGAPSPSREVFRHFFFAWPGRRGADGGFLNRQMLYTLPLELHGEYQRRVQSFLGELSEDLFH